MPHGTCSIAGCTTEGKLSRGMCRACYEWSRQHQWADPSGRMRIIPGQMRKDIPCPVVENGNVCGKPLATRTSGLCPAHNALKARNGSPTSRRIAPMGSVRATLVRGANPDTDDCIIIPGWAERPKVKFNDKQVPAARVVWMMVHGDPGEGVFIRHTCNGGSGAHGCVNLRHLRPGTPAENAADMVAADRQTRGERSPHHVLTDDAVREARALYADGGWTYKELGMRYGVSKSCMRRAVIGEGWKHVD